MSVVEVVQTTAKATSSSSSGFVLQRKCACGGSASFSGECEECKSKKLLGKPLQRKLAINEPGDEYEREADRVADQVMRMSEPPVDRDEPNTSRTPLVQRRVNGSGSAGIGTAPQIVHDVLSSQGQPLDAATRAFFEPRFGHDFSQVRIHPDTRSSESARAVNALAYTVGQDIVLGAGRVDLRSQSSRRLLAHELTHVIQQRHAGSMVQRSQPQNAPSCPTDIRIVKLHSIPFDPRAVPAGWFSGGGVVAEMEVSDPTNRDWTGARIHETMIAVSDDQCGKTKLCGNVGTGGPAGSTWPIPESSNQWGVNLPAKRNTFYDWHYSLIDYDVLGQAGLTSCKSQCEQTYDCVGGGALRPTFSIVRTLTPDNFLGKAVTRIAVSKTVK